MRVGELDIRDDGAIVRAGDVLTTMTDWDNPARIPTVAAPGKLPPGAGARILNAIAERARDAGIAALRYAGPYPTPALYRALLRSFRTDAREADFTADVLGRALRLATDELPFDFAPAPHRRVELERGWAELRDAGSEPRSNADTIERVVLDGVGYEPGGSPARLTDGRAEVWFGDAPYAVVAEFAADGTLLAHHDLPPCTSPVLHRAFPPPLRAAIAGLVAELVPAPLAPDVQRLIGERPLSWADLGGRAAHATPDGFMLHAALWDRLAPHGLARVALAVAEALAPVATTRVLAELTTAMA